MRVFFPISFILLLTYTSLCAQVTITGVSKTILCPGNKFNVNYTATAGSYLPGNVFRVQLSDINGNFSGTSPDIGYIASDASGTISCTVPLSISPGVLYRVRIVSDMPATVSTNTSVDLNVQNYPLPQLYSDSSACQGGPFLLKILNPLSGPPGTIQYSWYNPNGVKIQDGTEITVTTSPLLISGKYTVMAIYFGCRHSDTTVYATIKPRPATPTMNAEDTICSADTIHLTSFSTTPGVIYEWAGPNGFKSVSKDTSILNAPIAAQGYYKSFAISVPDGCRSFPDSQLVTVKLSPPVNAFNNGPLCEGKILQLTAGDSIDSTVYSWTGPGGFGMSNNDTFIYNATTSLSGDYIVAATLKDCISKDTTTVLIKPYPEKPEAGSNSPVCSGNTLLLTATGSSAGKYQWTGPDGYVADVQNPSRQNAATSMSGSYIISSDLNGCIRQDTAVVLVKPTPETPQIGDLGKVTENDTLKIEIKNPLAGASYRWDGPGGFTDSAMNLVIPGIQTGRTGLYYVTVGYDGCYAMSAVNIQVWQIQDTGKINLYPNPNNGNFILEGYLPLNEDVGISIHNSIGQTMYQRVVPTVGNLLRDKISIPFASSGIYYLRLRTGGKKEIIPFVIRH